MCIFARNLISPLHARLPAHEETLPPTTTSPIKEPKGIRTLFKQHQAFSQSTSALPPHSTSRLRPATAQTSNTSKAEDKLRTEIASKSLVHSRNQSQATLPMNMDSHPLGRPLMDNFGNFAYHSNFLNSYFKLYVNTPFEGWCPFH